ncbi:hypothetical protein HDU67_001650 [Dinochytrium kinnereticum]|nr:hypothetical protein HDU67_001650 [Dinochytrium kinnereticum]
MAQAKQTADSIREEIARNTRIETKVEIDKIEFKFSELLQWGFNIDLKLLEYRDYHTLQLSNRYGIFCVVIYQMMVLGLGDPTLYNIVISVAVGLPVIIAIPILGYYGVRKESRLLLLLNCAFSLFLICITIWRATRIFSKKTSVYEDYDRIRLPVTLFGLCALVLLLNACVFCWRCYSNFGWGLREVLEQTKKVDLEKVKVVDLDE